MQSPSPAMDPFTVIVMLAIHLVGSGGLMFLIWRLMPNAPGLGRWWIASSLFGMAYLGRLFGGLEVLDLRALAGDGLMLFAVLLFKDGVRDFVGRPVLRWPLVLALWAAMFGAEIAAALCISPSARHVVLNSAIGSMYLLMTWILLRHGGASQAQPLRAPLRLLTTLLGGLALLTLLRAWDIGLDGIDVAFDGLLAQVFYIYASLTAVVVGLTLIWMLFLRLNGQLADLATRDALTGVLNRHGLDEVVARHFARRDAPPLTALLVDIDHFKKINDSYGHATGDKVLQAVARTLNAQLRAGDFVARIGGEEFLIGCVEETHQPQDMALMLARRLNQSVRELPLRTADGTAPVACTVSIGLSPGCSSLRAWQKGNEQADQALYRAKQAGRDTVRSFSAG
ncbi:GGDEF domain-containing protein [Variovorax sp. HJSM1_2]|uniref:GGDEF domain-containing protein n=1 Tax=Variovorax sp. HJSM1_2 TaxID=3366263 RepID=UPI003BCCB8BA